ncbi:MAG: DUF1080 domain-containing protein [Planctomyces sp.]|jgi:hypothetical protein
MKRLFFGIHRMPSSDDRSVCVLQAGLLAQKCLSLLVFFSLLVLLLPAAEAQGPAYTNLLSDAGLSMWMKTDGSAVSGGWLLESDGVLHLKGDGGNIITREQYGDFDLWFEYRIASKGNSGIKYRVTQYDTSWLGPEYQIQDDAAFPDMGDKHLTASLYDLISISQPIFRRSYRTENEFNVGRILVQNNHVRHWQNGNLVIDECFGAPRFQAAVSESKFRDRAGFGTNRVGRLMLTDHHSEVWFRNVFVRRLDSCR